MAQVAVTVVDAAAVHRAHGTRQLKGQGMLDGRHGRLLDPVQGQVFQADDGGQFLGDDERVLVGRVAAFFTERHGGHGRYAKRLQALDRHPLLARAQHR